MDRVDSLSATSLTERFERCEALLGGIELADARPERARQALAALGGLLRRQQAIAQAGLQARLQELLRRSRLLLPVQQARAALERIEIATLVAELQRQLVEPVAEATSAGLHLLIAREHVAATLGSLDALELAQALEQALARLRQGLERFDRLGQAGIERLLHLNAQRQALSLELDPEAGASWWWALRATCDPLALVAFTDGELAEPQQSAVLAHLEACSSCRDDLAWLARITQLVGPRREGHPSTALLLAYSAGELEAAQRHELAGHLASCESCAALRHAAQAGLATAEGLEQSARRSAAVDSCRPALVYAFASLPVVRRSSAHASLPEDEAPVPEDRRVLVEEAGLFRVVYYRIGARAYLGLFAEQGEALALESCTLEEVPLAVTRAREGLVLVLGAAAALLGRTLLLSFSLAGKGYAYSWVLVDE